MTLSKPRQNSDKLKVAVIGTGISGLSAAWLLNKSHDITVYEQNGYVGGHSNTSDVVIEGKTIPVDTGFIVFNPVNYPNLVALFEHLDVESNSSEMSFAASLNDKKLEYSGTDLNGLFAQRRNIFRPRFLRMLKDLQRFYSQAESQLDDETLRELTLAEFLHRERYSDAFIYDHLMPMGAAIWSSSVKQMLAFPTLAFLRFFKNHGLIQLTNRPEWRTVSGGSREYVRKLTAGFADHIHCRTPVTKFTRNDGRCTLTTADGHTTEFDHVVLACHADQALSLIDQPSREEQETLGQIRYQNNVAVLHSDTTLMPKRRRAWASWNYMGTGDSPADQALCVTYWMNRLQNLDTDTPILVTLNPIQEIAPEKIIREFNYTHPIFDVAALQAQRRLWTLQGQHNTWFCGAYFGSGFHEDGIQAGLAVAEKLGYEQRPWTVNDPSGRVGLTADGSPLTEWAPIPA
jgi:predicted NAD/FAD-binding protein